MLIPTSRIFDKMMTEIEKAKNTADDTAVKQCAGRIQLLCELLLEEQKDGMHAATGMESGNGIVLKEVKENTQQDHPGDSLLDF